ncbi:hypothetical protein Fuma_02913 [Fuerstiella marisgermanici]|uniref:Uncharacterized protein n=1 Tax=Fuerstiella marisgermanici TaxID=1891926 RepID=A0A1P8WGT5_9PLAN|nr:hypothetical protein Fuma_02913 [Fuerstiella marisgermanici]
MNPSKHLLAILKAPARVLGYFSHDYLRITVLAGHGMADGGIQHDILWGMVPSDLRLPNSDSTVLIDRSKSQFVGVERIQTTGNE